MAEQDAIISKVKRLLGEYAGVFLGEIHHKSGTLDWLKSHMQELKDAGVTRLYIEHVAAEKQEYLDNYMANIPGAREALRHNGLIVGFRDESYMEVLDAAKEAGIKLVAIDHDNMAQAQQKGLEDIGYNFEGSSYRTRISNPFWKKIIKGDFADATPGEKYIVWGGMKHSNRVNGIDKMLGIPSIDLVDGLSLLLRGNLGTTVPEPEDRTKLHGDKPIVYPGNSESSFAAYIPYDKEKDAISKYTPDPFTDNEFKLYSALTFDLDAKTLTPEIRKELQDVVDLMVSKKDALKEAPDELSKELGELTPLLPQINKDQALQVFGKPRGK